MKWLVLAGLALTSVAPGRELAGVVMPEQIEVEGRTLVLNGLGLREATVFKVDVYVAGLYLEEKTTDPDAILELTQALQIRMEFLRHVGRNAIVETWDESFDKHAEEEPASYRDGLRKLDRFMSDMSRGDTMIYTYFPEREALRVEIRDEARGLIPGAAFARAFLRVWIGPRVGWEKLKCGLLGLTKH